MNSMDLRALAQSVQQRLLNRRDRTGEDFNVLLVRYAVERLSGTRSGVVKNSD